MIWYSALISKVFERVVLVRLGQFMECSGVLPNHPVCLSERSGYL